jgi:hypothetical protein
VPRSEGRLNHRAHFLFYRCAASGRPALAVTVLVTDLTLTQRNNDITPTDTHLVPVPLAVTREDPSVLKFKFDTLRLVVARTVAADAVKQCQSQTTAAIEELLHSSLCYRWQLHRD